MFKDNKLTFMRFIISFIFSTILIVAVIIFFVSFITNESGQGRALLLIFTFVSAFACLGNCGSALPIIIANRRRDKNIVSLVLLVITLSYMVLSVIFPVIEMILY